MKSSYKRLGDFVEPIDEFNVGNQIEQLLGISNKKHFQKSQTNTIGIDLSKYRVVRDNHFAFNRATTRNSDKISIALKQGGDCIVSPSYRIFKSKDENKLHSEYLWMWFTRPEFDRYARFKSHGSAHEFFDMDEMQEVTLPIPHIEKQREIVAEYNTIQNRIKLNEQLIQKLEETAQTIYREWFVEFEFPDENGKPYKSNGGEMVWCVELGKEIPKGWEIKPISDAGEIKAGGDKPNVFSEAKTSLCQIPIYSNGITNDGLYGYTNKNNYPKNSITISARGTIGFCVLRREDFDAIVRLLVLIPNYPESAIYLWQTIKQIEFDNSGSVQNQLTIPQIGVIDILFPRIDILNKYDSIVSLIYQNVDLINKENQKLTELKELLLSKLATVV